jgi:hypothetical protein
VDDGTGAGLGTHIHFLALLQLRGLAGSPSTKETPYGLSSAQVDAIRLERHDIDIALASSWMAVIRTSGCAAGDIALEGMVCDVFEARASMGNRVNQQIAKLCDLECVE